MLAKAEAKELLKKTQFEEAHNETTNWKNTYITKGLLYYDNKKRASLLESAETLCYSKDSISHLRSFTCENWNSDNVTIEDIREFQSIESYVHQNLPLWEKSVIAKFGKFVNQEN